MNFKSGSSKIEYNNIPYGTIVRVIDTFKDESYKAMVVSEIINDNVYTIEPIGIVNGEKGKEIVDYRRLKLVSEDQYNIRDRVSYTDTEGNIRLGTVVEVLSDYLAGVIVEFDEQFYDKFNVNEDLYKMQKQYDYNCKMVHKKDLEKTNIEYTDFKIGDIVTTYSGRVGTVVNVGAELIIDTAISLEKLPSPAKFQSYKDSDILFNKTSISISPYSVTKNLVGEVGFYLDPNNSIKTVLKIGDLVSFETSMTEGSKIVAKVSHIDSIRNIITFKNYDCNIGQKEVYVYSQESCSFSIGGEGIFNLEKMVLSTFAYMHQDEIFDRKALGFVYCYVTESAKRRLPYAKVFFANHLALIAVDNNKFAESYKKNRSSEYAKELIECFDPISASGEVDMNLLRHCQNDYDHMPFNCFFFTENFLK